MTEVGLGGSPPASAGLLAAGTVIILSPVVGVIAVYATGAGARLREWAARRAFERDARRRRAP